MNREARELVDRYVPEMRRSDGNPFASESEDPCDPVVLEALEQDRPGDKPLSILCPACTTVLRRYTDGLPARLVHFREACEGCNATLKRWSVVAVNSAFEKIPTAAELRRITTTYWEENLWSGIVTGESNPRTREFSEAYSQQARDFGWSWTVRCPLCRRSVADIENGRLDYHHWWQDPDTGVCLCRTCHDAIGARLCDRDLDWQAQELGLRNKHELQVTRLALCEQVTSDHERLRCLVETLCERYNLVQSRAEVYAMLSETLSQQSLLDEIADDCLFAGLDTAGPAE